MIPVIGFSKQVQQADIEKSKQAGFAAYLAKPVDLQELERAIKSAFRGGAAS